MTLNRAASEVMRQFPLHACSDVTGFGLLGHASEMASGSDVTLSVDAAALTLLDGALELAQLGHLIGGCGHNRDYLREKVVVGTKVGNGSLLCWLVSQPQHAPVVVPCRPPTCTDARRSDTSAPRHRCQRQDLPYRTAIAG